LFAIGPIEQPNRALDRRRTEVHGYKSRYAEQDPGRTHRIDTCWWRRILGSMFRTNA